ncbi:olfactory receptor 52E4-like [Stegastes partitus]|uniref:Olfactory receptor 52E4-like n=1 Tax=Stegastes partitus TaxID=144197 RepID=A0A9Y4NPT3_9TELE|nr:PREDICTED: olfactory receptor 52E4-like [Stegastes partitus]
MSNISSYRHFLLDGFGDLGALRSVLFLPFTAMFVVSLLANSLLLYVVVSNRSLHSPMCILIAAMAVVDLSLPLFFVPSMLLNFLLGWRSISLSGCLLQMHLLHFLGALQSTLLVWMALDRYFAICTPLSYHQRMAPQRFLWFVAPLVLRNGVIVSLLVGLAGTLTFCRNVIQHCFCEHMALVELSCGWPAVNSLLGLLAVVFIPVTDFLLIFASYVLIFGSVLRSGQSSVRALHTCVTHLLVMAVSLTVALIAFLSYRVRTSLPASIRVFFSTMYLLVPSCFNPIIYGIRTAEIRQHILKTLRCCLRVRTKTGPEPTEP